MKGCGGVGGARGWGRLSQGAAARWTAEGSQRHQAPRPVGTLDVSRRTIAARAHSVQYRLACLAANPSPWAKQSCVAISVSGACMRSAPIFCRVWLTCYTTSNAVPEGYLPCQSATPPLLHGRTPVKVSWFDVSYSFRILHTVGMWAPLVVLWNVVLDAPPA